MFHVSQILNCSAHSQKVLGMNVSGVLQFCRHHYINSKLEHIGILNEHRTNANYEIGQTFLHRIFAYRGVILHPWEAKVYEKNNQPRSDINNTETSCVAKHALPKLETYYQALVDSRDSFNNAVKCEVSYLKCPGKENYPIETIPDMDYISHDDIIPYISIESTPIHHDLFEKFLMRDKNALLQGTSTFLEWQNKNRMWLQLSNVHVETSNNIKVTVIPFYLGVKSLTHTPVYWWRYCIRIENLGNKAVKLCRRYWRIISNGMVTRRPGRGVIGKEPILSNEYPAFQYSSQVPLWTPSGHMWGTYLFEQEDGKQFDVRIPAFALESSLNFDTTNTIT